MTEPVISRAEIAERAREAAAEYARTGRTPMNPFPALSTAAREFDVALRRYMGSHDETEEASA